MIVCGATLNDLEGIKKLLDDLNVSSVELLPDFFKIAKTEDEEVKSTISDKNSEILLAKESEKVIGVAKISFKTPKDIPVLVKNPYVYIENFIVDSNYRRKGVGKALINGIKKWGAKRGVKHFRLSVIPTNYSAISFYEKEGFKEFMYSMEMTVRDGDL